ncbi:MAG TPA: ArsA-related P-loop ATPase, partial [Actinomycetota bacterium]|nr:ArsA-related P-loop ATPase [Actinomycetota bacterium]
RTLEAMQLDTKRTLDALVARHAGSEAQRDRILANRFYARIADTLAGTHEYMAMEKLYELATEGDHETIVVDTPPTRSALSFLDAPRRMTDFLGGRFLRFMLAPTSVGARGTLRLTALGAQAFGRALRAITGGELLADTAEFLSAFEGMYDGFKRRAAAVLDLLRRPGTRFVIVTSPEPGAMDEAGYFAERLAEAGMPLAAVVANRTHLGRPRLDPAVAGAVPRLEGGAPAARALAAAIRTRLAWQAVEDREAAALDAFHARHGGVLLTTVPDLGRDVHDLPGLRRLASALFEGG